jgi:hypothetical protein
LLVNRKPVLLSVSLLAVLFAALPPTPAAHAVSARPCLSPGNPEVMGFTPIYHTRVLDTRVGLGAARARVGPQGVVELAVAGAGLAVPADAGAVVINVTAVMPSSRTYIAVWPTDPAITGVQPLASTVSLPAGTVRANSTTVKVGAGGEVSLGNSSGSVDLVVDVEGYYSPAGLYRMELPATDRTFQRIVDTRIGKGALKRKIPAGGYIDVQVGGTAFVPTSVDASAVILNVTAVAPSAATYLTAYPTPADATGPPRISHINAPAGAIRSDMVTVEMGAGGRVRVFNANGTTDVLVDLLGFYATWENGGIYCFVPLGPWRIEDTRIDPPALGTTADSRPWTPIIQGNIAMLNVTAINPSVPTYLWGEPGWAAHISNLNVKPGETAAAAMMSTTTSIRNAAGLVNIVTDVEGVFGE